jgi:peptidoglycan biosynthesis protein MviN/MurJ (putative lipid II flippase)
MVAVSAIAFSLLRAPIGLSIAASGFGLVCAPLVGLLAVVDSFTILAVGGLALSAAMMFCIVGVIGLVYRSRRKTRLDDGRVAVIGMSLALIIGVVPWIVWTLWPTTPIESVLVGIAVVGFVVSVLLAAVVQQHSRPVAPRPPLASERTS